jgi:hypothetical protein
VPAPETLLFRESQSFHLGYARIGSGLKVAHYPRIALAIPPVALIVITLRQIVWHHPWGNPPATNGGLVFLNVLLLLVFIRLMTVRLVTELRPNRLSVAMKGLFRRIRVPVAGIRSATAVRYDPVADYGGYGIRSGRLGRAYIASGNQAVQLELKDGSKLLVGSARPAELARMIGEAQQRKT